MEAKILEEIKEHLLDNRKSNIDEQHSQQWCYIAILLYFSFSNTKMVLQ